MDKAIALFQNQTNTNTKLFSLLGEKMYGRVVDIHDGDTITVVLNLFGSFFKFKVRLSEIDTCEITSKVEQNKSLAIQAKVRLISLICNRDVSNCLLLSDKKTLVSFLENNNHCVWLECLNFDKFGRLLANIFSNESSTESFSQILIKENLAYRYEGKTKLTEQQQIELLCNKYTN
jgi:endonuclease YncB( thermonuclease family)